MDENDSRELRFDRGTLLFRGTWPDAIRGVQGVLWDPRVRAFRAPAYFWRRLRLEMETRRIALSDRVSDVQPLSGNWGKIELRPYQEAGLRAWETADRRGVIVLPTGSGKTRTAIAAMARARCATLCIAPTRVLLEQWRSEIKRFYDGPVGCYGDGVYEVAPITVATNESAYRRMGELGNRFQLLVVDEVHHFGANMRDEALEMAIAPSRLGLTATPVSDVVPAARLEELIGPIVYELAIADLSGGFLADFELFVLHLELTREERGEYEVNLAAFRAVHERFRRSAPGATWAEFASAASATDEGRRALAGWRRVRKLLAFTRGKLEAVATLLARHRDARVLVFTADNETAYELSRQHLIMPLTCDIGREERDDVLGKFRSGELRALVSARVLNEGLDVPDADVAIVVGGALGTREHVQRVGRLLRPSPGKKAVVYELVSRGTLEVKQASRRRAGLGTGTTASI